MVQKIIFCLKKTDKQNSIGGKQRIACLGPVHSSKFYLPFSRWFYCDLPIICLLLYDYFCYDRHIAVYLRLKLARLQVIWILLSRSCDRDLALYVFLHLL